MVIYVSDIVRIKLFVVKIVYNAVLTIGQEMTDKIHANNSRIF